jgi:hypothetical protein
MQFTKAAAARILKVAANQVLRIEVWAHVVLVVVKGKGGRFVSKRDFATDFRSLRIGNANHVRLAAVHRGVVRLETCDGPNIRWHSVKVVENRAVCDCEDWSRQDASGSRQPICKHLVRCGWELSEFRSLIAA